jgi:hypothetical protein
MVFQKVVAFCGSVLGNAIMTKAVLLCVYPDTGPRTQEHKLSHHSKSLALMQ